MENVLVKEVERLLQTNYHIYMNIEEANDCQRYQIIGNMLMAYDLTWVTESIPVLIGKTFDVKESSSTISIGKNAISKMKSWLNRIGVGHLIPPGTSLADKKKFLRLIQTIMEKTPEKNLKANIRMVVQKQNKINAKSSTKNRFHNTSGDSVFNTSITSNVSSTSKISDANISGKKGPRLSDTSILEVSNLENNIDKKKPQKNVIPTGSKQLPRTPPKSPNRMLINDYQLSSIISSPKKKNTAHDISHQELVKEKTGHQISNIVEPLTCNELTKGNLSVQAINVKLKKVDPSPTTNNDDAESAKENIKPEKPDINERKKINPSKITKAANENEYKKVDMQISSPSTSIITLNSSNCNDVSNTQASSFCRLKVNMIPSGNQLPRTPHANKQNRSDTAVEVSNKCSDPLKPHSNIIPEKHKVHESSEKSYDALECEISSEPAVAFKNMKNKAKYIYLQSVKEWERVKDGYLEIPSDEVQTFYSWVIEEYKKEHCSKIKELKKDAKDKEKRLSIIRCPVSDDNKENKPLENNVDQISAVKDKIYSEIEMVVSDEISTNVTANRTFNTKKKEIDSNSETSSLFAKNVNEATFTINKNSTMNENGNMPSPKNCIENAISVKSKIRLASNKNSSPKKTKKESCKKDEPALIQKADASLEQSLGDGTKKIQIERKQKRIKRQEMTGNRSPENATSKEQKMSLAIDESIDENKRKLSRNTKYRGKKANGTKEEEKMTLVSKQTDKTKKPDTIKEPLFKANLDASKLKTRQKDINETIDVVIQKVSGLKSNREEDIKDDTSKRTRRTKRTISVQSDSGNNEKMNCIQPITGSSGSTPGYFDSTGKKETDMSEKPTQDIKEDKSKRAKGRPKRTISVKSGSGNNENKNCFRPTEGNAASNPVLLDPTNKAEIGMSEKPIQSQPKKSKRFRLKNSESKTSVDMGVESNKVSTQPVAIKKTKSSITANDNAQNYERAKNEANKKDKSIDPNKCSERDIEIGNNNIMDASTNIPPSVCLEADTTLRRSKRVQNNQSILNRNKCPDESLVNASVVIDKPKPKNPKKRNISKDSLKQITENVIQIEPDQPKKGQKIRSLKNIDDVIYSTPTVKIEKPKSKAKTASNKDKRVKQNSVEVMPSIAEKVTTTNFNQLSDDIYETPVKKRRNCKGAKI